MNIFKKNLVQVAASAFALSALPASAALYNLTDTTFTDTTPTTYAPDMIAGFTAVIVEGSIFQRASTGSGNGNFRDLFSFSSADNPDGQRAYNRDSNSGLDEFIGGGPADQAAAKITKADLVTDSSGLFYVFMMDMNENGYNSIDDVRIWVDTDSVGDDNPIDGVGGDDGGPYPENLTDLASALGVGDLVYDFNETEDNTILLDGTISNGSGTSDLNIYVPTSSFATYDDADYVYFYMQMGAYDHNAEHGLDLSDPDGVVSIVSSQGNGESIAIPAADIEVFTAVPEPSSIVLLLSAVCLGIGRRSR